MSSKIMISNKVVGVTLSGHQRLNKYTDEQLVAFVDRCKDQPMHWHVMFRHRSIQGARQKVFHVNHSERFANLPLDYRAIRAPDGLIDTAAWNVGGYVVAKYSRDKKKLQTRTDHFLDVAALSERKQLELLAAIENGGVFKIPASAYSVAIGYVEEEPEPEPDVYGETFDPEQVEELSADPAPEAETEEVEETIEPDEPEVDEFAEMARAAQEMTDTPPVELEENFDDIF